MKIGWMMGIAAAVTAHAGILAFGGWFFLKEGQDEGQLQEVELLGDEPQQEEEKKEEEPPEPDTEEEMEAEVEEAPDAAEIIRSLELSAAAAAPALDDASLGAIEQALAGSVGSGAFADGISFASGGRIGGTGEAGALDEKVDSIFSLTEIDQKPRPVFQAAPLYPSEMRGKKVEGVVTVIFVVDAAGKVTSPRIEKSTLAAFEKPALEAIKQWKFEPAVKGGQRVSCKMRVPIRFQPS